MQGTRDIAVHVGTPHFTARAVLNRFGATSTTPTC